MNSLIPNHDCLPMKPRCPQCHSQRIETKNYAKKTGGTIGTVAGAASGAAAAMRGAEAAGDPGDGSTGTLLSIVAGAILGGLVGGVAGCAVGAKLGDVVDNTILDNCHCLECGCRFSQPRV